MIDRASPLYVELFKIAWSMLVPRVKEYQEKASDKWSLEAELAGLPRPNPAAQIASDAAALADFAYLQLVPTKKDAP